MPWGAALGGWGLSPQPKSSLAPVSEGEPAKPHGTNTHTGTISPHSGGPTPTCTSVLTCTRGLFLQAAATSSCSFSLLPAWGAVQVSGRGTEGAWEPKALDLSPATGSLPRSSCCLGTRLPLAGDLPHRPVTAKRRGSPRAGVSVPLSPVAASDPLGSFTGAPGQTLLPAELALARCRPTVLEPW